jgi:hypothetical protein
MKINAEDVFFVTEEGKQTTLVDFMQSVLATMQMLKIESVDASNILLVDDNGDTLPLEDSMWGCINAIEGLNDRLLDLETRKISKPH